MELCQQTCTNLLNLDPENESASIMMADIAFRKVDFDMALFHFTQLLNKQPTNWAALVRLVEIFRRTGNVDGAAPFLEKAEQNCTKKELGIIIYLFMSNSHLRKYIIKNNKNIRPLNKFIVINLSENNSKSN